MVGRLRCAPRWSFLVVSSANQRFDEVEPRARGGGEVHDEPGVAPRCDPGLGLVDSPTTARLERVC